MKVRLSRLSFVVGQMTLGGSVSIDAILAPASAAAAADYCVVCYIIFWLFSSRQPHLEDLPRKIHGYAVSFSLILNHFLVTATNSGYLSDLLRKRKTITTITQHVLRD